MHGLTLDPGGHLQATITLTSGAKQADQIFYPVMFVFQRLALPTVTPAGPENIFFFFGDAFKRGNKPKGCFGETLSIKGKAELDAFVSSLFCFILLRQACVLIFSLFFVLE